MSESGSSSTPLLKDPKLSAMSKAFARVDLDGHDLPPSPAPSSPRGGRQYSIATQLVYSEGNDQYNASSVPIYQVSMDALDLKAYTDNLPVRNLQAIVCHRGRLRL